MFPAKKQQPKPPIFLPVHKKDKKVQTKNAPASEKKAPWEDILEFLDLMQRDPFPMPSLDSPLSFARWFLMMGAIELVANILSEIILRSWSY